MELAAEVNFHEAVAFANWKNESDKQNKKTTLTYRLMTEAEYISLRSKGADPVLQKAHYKDLKTTSEFKANYNFKFSTPENVSSELYGNVWHWLEDQFNPLSEFSVHPYYDDFSSPCFDGKHQMILGGSFISCGDEASHFSRFHLCLTSISTADLERPHD